MRLSMSSRMPTKRFIAAQGFAKGSMNLIDAPRAQSLYDAMGPAIESSGGSAGNTMAGIASLGGAGAYIGKVRDDELGAVFRHDFDGDRRHSSRRRPRPRGRRPRAA